MTFIVWTVTVVTINLKISGYRVFITKHLLEKTFLIHYLSLLDEMKVHGRMKALGMRMWQAMTLVDLFKFKVK